MERIGGSSGNLAVSDDHRRRLVTWVGVHVMPHEPAVRAWLSRAMLNPADVDDLIQEAYCKMAGLTAFETIANPAGYFFGVCRNMVADHVRRARVVRFEVVAELDSLGLHSEEPSPERAVAARRELRRVQDLIAGLPDRCRKVFELRKIHGRSQKDIAAELGISESAVENEGVKGLRLILRALAEAPAAPSAAAPTLDHGADASRSSS